MQVTKEQRVPAVARVWAMVSLVAGAGLVVSVVLFLFRNGAAVAGALVGLVVGISGAWWAVTRQGARRAGGIAATVVGVGVLALALLAAV